MDTELIMQLVENFGTIPLLVYLIVKVQSLGKSLTEVKNELTFMRSRVYNVDRSAGCVGESCENKQMKVVR